MKKSKTHLALLIFLSVSFMISCSSSKKSGMKTNDQMMGVPSPSVMVYKTKVDYFQNVPVLLSADKQSIISYPAPSDLRKGDNYVYPTKLSNGYLLDNRGIGTNTAFLKFSYEDYYTMDNIPNGERLMNYILDDDPFSELYELGRWGDYEDIEAELNQLIEKKKLKKSKNLAK